MGQGTVQQMAVMRHLRMPTALHGLRGAPLFLNLSSFQPFLIKKKEACLQTKQLLLLVTYQITHESIGKATVNKSRIQIRHQRNLVIGSLAPCESIFCQTDETLYMLVSALLLLSYNTAIPALSLKCY